MRRLIYLAQLGRMGMAPLTISVPILGILANDGPQSFTVYLCLGLVGLCAHLFGFVLNDIIDLPLDRTLTERQRHPLVTGKLTYFEAWTFTLLQVPLAFCLYLLASVHLTQNDSSILQGSALGMGALCASMLLSMVYNHWSKWGRLPRFLSELALAFSIGLLCLTGMLAGASTIKPVSLFYALSLVLVLLLVNSVSSGLKDLKTDARFGAKSFVLSTGSRMLGEDRIFISKTLWLYSTVLQLMLLLCVMVLLIYTQPSWLIIVVVCLLELYACLHLRMTLAHQSFRKLRKSKPLLNGYYNYVALALLMVAWMPTGLQIFYGLVALLLLLLPWRLSYRMWRNRYYGLPAHNTIIVPDKFPHLEA